MKEINYLITGILFGSLLLISCNQQEPFNKEKWFAKDDILYTERKYMIDDLLTNYLKKGACINDIKNLLGEHVEIARRKMDYHIFYEIETKYGSNIDPKWIKYLEIKLNADSCFVEAQVLTLN